MRPITEKTNYEELFRVDMTYKNVITQSEEKCDEYLYVARTNEWDEINLDVIEQHNRVKVAKKLKQVLKYVNEDNRNYALKELEKAKRIIEKSITKDSSLSICIQNELAKLILMVQGNLETAKMPLEESLKSHWHEKGGWSSCYLTRKEDTMITVVKSTSITD
jgi:sulfur relay (sulfurtransferase) DsrC/TusE family protein